jgi:hypothetical protein
MRRRDESFFALQSGETARPWVLETDEGIEVVFLPSDGWDVYEV